MRVWLITIGEPLPSDGDHPRLLRTGIVARMLAERGHDVLWWNSTFDHQRKRQRFASTTRIHVAPQYEIVLLHGPAYKTNISLRRMLHHAILGVRFRRAIRGEPRPDVIVCSIPIVELALPATRYARQHGLAIVLDMRDLWPDMFVDLAPPPLRPVARAALAPYFAMTRFVCRRATAIIGITDWFVKWGVALAGRAATNNDRDFPLSYSRQLPPEDALETARAFWDERDVCGDSFLAAFIGVLGSQFDLDTVIEAARIAERRGDPARFVICGDGPNAARYRRAAAGLTNVLFAGWVDAAQIWILMERASVGLTPYVNSTAYQASIPTKAIEYLAGGLPVISSLQGTLAALLAERNCGVTYPDGDAAFLADTLCELRCSPDATTRMSRNASAAYEERFVAERVYGDLIEYLQKLAGMK